jgi:colanic acid/amylovoran biosynthesis glycosyltransferase
MVHWKIMRILVVTGEFPALSETFVLDQITGLIDRGFTVDILAARASPEPKVHPGVAAYRLIERTHYAAPGAHGRHGSWQSARIILSQIAQRRFGLVIEMVRAGVRRKLGKAVSVEPRQILAYTRTLETLPVPDVVLCHFGPQGDLMIRVRKALGARWPVATFFHGYDVSTLLMQMGPHLYDRLFREGDIHFPACEYFRSRLLKLGAAEEKTVVQRMCVHPGINFTAPLEAATKTVGEFTFVLIGRLVEKKGHEYAIRAIACCRNRSLAVKIRLVIIGDGALDTSLRQLIHQLDLDSLVELRGSHTRDRVQQALLAAGGFVLPSVTAANGDMEASPVVISEAMSVGLPVVATRHGGIPEIVEDGVSGLLVAERDVSALAGAMSRVAGDPELARRLGQAGRNKIVRELDLDRWNDLLAERLRALAASGGVHK